MKTAVTRRERNVLKIDPKTAAEEMIRLFGEEAAGVVRERASMFLARQDLENAHMWLSVRANVLNLLHAEPKDQDTRH